MKDKVVKYEKKVMEHNLKLYKTGTNSYKQTGNLDRFTKPFRIRHQEDRFPNYDWEKLAENNFSDLLVKVSLSPLDQGYTSPTPRKNLKISDQIGPVGPWWSVDPSVKLSIFYHF